MSSLFLDTGYLIALEALDDQYHQIAIEHWRTLLPTHPSFVTTSYIHDEVVTFFNSRSHHTKAVEVGNHLLNSPSIDFIHVDESLFKEGWEYFQKHQDKAYSLTDCVSFVLMKQLQIHKALSFDQHFIQAGFKRIPESL